MINKDPVLYSNRKYEEYFSNSIQLSMCIYTQCVVISRVCVHVHTAVYSLKLTGLMRSVLTKMLTCTCRKLCDSCNTSGGHFRGRFFEVHFDVCAHCEEVLFNSITPFSANLTHSRNILINILSTCCFFLPLDTHVSETYRRALSRTTKELHIQPRLNCLIFLQV